VKQRVSLITLGVTHLSCSRRFYEALGWETGASPDDGLGPLIVRTAAVEPPRHRAVSAAAQVCAGISPTPPKTDWPVNQD
jgi:hypothetical protein